MRARSGSICDTHQSRWRRARLASSSENDAPRHPDHSTFQEVAPGVWDAAFPIHPKGWLGVKTRRACRKAGGHWWHPADAMILWKCCACGADRDGMPKDGS